MAAAPDSSPRSSDPIGPPSRSKRRRWIVAIKVVLGILVLLAVGRHVLRTWNDLHAQGRALRINPIWASASVGLYLAGLCAFGLFFWRILRESPTPIPALPCLRAYLISHLGKYVPGKAMVVVMRAGLVTPYGARPATAAFATFYETLVMMAAGGLFGAAGFAYRPVASIQVSLGNGPSLSVPPLALCLALGIPFLILAAPRVFPRLLAVMSMPFPGVGPEARPRFSHGLLGEGLAYSFAGWALLGLSQVAVIRALTPAQIPIVLWPMILASVALATVGGFAVAILPGGLGVRELIIMTTLAPAIGKDTAVIAALALRLSWVIGEVLATALLVPFRPPPPRPAGPSP